MDVKSFITLYPGNENGRTETDAATSCDADGDARSDADSDDKRCCCCCAFSSKRSGVTDRRQRSDAQAMSSVTTVTNDDDDVTETDGLAMPGKRIPRFVYELAKKGADLNQVFSRMRLG